MEKQKLTVSYILHNWNRLSMEQKRAILSIVVFAVAALLIVIALIIGVSSCKCEKTQADAAETAAEIPALLRAPDPTERQQTQDPDPSDPEAEANLPEIVATDDPNEPDDEPDPSASPDGTESQYETLKKHDKGDAVTALQKRLMELGYLEIEEPTDYYGNSTAYAVSLFQRQHDLKQDGIAGEQTQALLFSKDAKHYTMFEGAEGRDVKMLQEQLVDLGYLSKGDVDYIYGEKTVEAVKAFQRRNGLTVDGKAGEKTLDKLYSEQAKISKELEAKQKAEEKAAKEKEKQTSKTSPSPTPKKDTRIDKFVNAAKSKVGCEYVLGDRGPNTFDCSGLVHYCLRQAGVIVTRMNAANFSKVKSWKNITSISALQRGDILFFRSDESSAISHCGIYIGNGYMIDASSSNGKVMQRPLSNYWKRNFVNARRPW